jgi:hypothetical protein
MDKIKGLQNAKRAGSTTPKKGRGIGRRTKMPTTLKRLGVLVLGICMLLAMAGSLLARRGSGLPSPALRSVAFPQASPTPPALSKEYIYQGAGGPLIATEEQPTASPSPPPAAPTLSQISPSSGVPGATVNVTITGAGFQNPIQITFNNAAALTATNVNATSSGVVTATIVIQSYATLGSYMPSLTANNVLAANPLGLTFSVVAPPPQTPGAPIISGVMPSTVYPGQTNDPVIITGSGFTTVNPLSGVTVTKSGVINTGVTVNLPVTVENDNQILLSVTVIGAAVIGSDTLTVTNSINSTTSTLTVAAVPNVAPLLTGVTPATVTAGTATPIAVTGSNLSAAAFFVDNQQFQSVPITAVLSIM